MERPMLVNLYKGTFKKVEVKRTKIIFSAKKKTCSKTELCKQMPGSGISAVGLGRLGVLPEDGWENLHRHTAPSSR